MRKFEKVKSKKKRKRKVYLRENVSLRSVHRCVMIVAINCESASEMSFYKLMTLLQSFID